MRSMKAARPTRSAALELGSAVGPAAVMSLACLDPSSLDDAALLEAAAAVETQLAWLASVGVGFLAEIEHRAGPVEPAITSEEPADWAREQLAAACRLSPYEARSRLDTAAALAHRLPATGRALAAGRISWQYAVAVASETAHDPAGLSGTVEQTVLLDARVTTAAQARRAARREMARLLPAVAAEAQAAVHADRHLRLYPDRDGLGYQLVGTFPTDMAAVIHETISGLAVRHGPDDTRLMDTRRADALYDLCLTASGVGHGSGAGAAATGQPGSAACSTSDGPTAGPEDGHSTSDEPTAAPHAERSASGGPSEPRAPIRVSILLDLPTLLAQAQNPATLTGAPGGPAPITPEMARRWACEVDLLHLIGVDPRGRPVDLGRSARQPSAALRRLMTARDRGCRFPGCTTSPARCHAHHIVWWERGGTTDLCNLLLLCSRHHHAVHEGGWQVALAADGSVTWRDPDGRSYLSPGPLTPRDPSRTALRQHLLGDPTGPADPWSGQPWTDLLHPDDVTPDTATSHAVTSIAVGEPGSRASAPDPAEPRAGTFPDPGTGPPC